MAAMGMDDDFDPEDLAEDLAARAYMRVVLGKAVAVIAVAALGLALVAGDYVFGVMALWLLPRLVSWLLAAFTAVEFYVMTEGYIRSLREKRGQDAGLSEGEQALADTDRLRDRPSATTWWHPGPRSPRFWRGLVIRSVYSACAGLVLVSHFGLVAGGVITVAFTAGLLAWQARSGTVVAGGVAAAAFADPRPPRDTPEI